MRRATTIIADDRGRPLHVKFELGASLSYSIRYVYDDEHLRIDFSPGVGVREAVTGFAAFEPHPDGCTMTYALAAGPGRAARDDAAGDPNLLVRAFKGWVESVP